jgi:hypothetical protein
MAVMHATCPAPLIFLDLMTLIIFGGTYKLVSLNIEQHGKDELHHRPEMQRRF